MKVNKLISRGLALGFLLNYASLLSYANTEIPNRYQTLEGEYITIDDSTEGNLKEIEIFGNTVQNPNNLEDIQSVGKLYVDEQGEPILDKHGREQYKIEINSNDTIVYDFKLEKGRIESNGNIATNTHNQFRSAEFVRVTYRNIYLSTFKRYSGFIQLLGYDENKQLLINLTCSQDKLVTIPDNVIYIKVSSRNMLPEDFDYTFAGFYCVGTSSVLDSYSQAQSSKTTILLPCQLQKVGDVVDRLYWDSEKCKYIVEKNIGSTIIAKTSGFRAMSHLNNNIFAVRVSDMKPNNDTPHITSIRKSTPIKNVGKIEYIGYTYTSVANWNAEIRFIESLDTTLEYFLNNLIPDDGFVAFYELNTPQLIETNITIPIKIPTYSDKTYISTVSENGIKPTLKISIDRIEEVSQEVVDVALSNPISSNIALARMFVNMLPDSLYKDQLQTQLNELFSEDMVLDKKSVSANLDLYIKSENMLQMSLITNSITFDDFSGVEDMTKENAVQISINSSLPYSLNAYLPTEIQNSEKSNTMNKDILNIKENSESIYQTFSNINEKLILKDNNPTGNNLSHGIDIKLKGNIAHQKDVYKTTIKFEAEQK